MNGALFEHERIVAAANLLIARGAMGEEEGLLAGHIESLYRLAREPHALSALSDWLAPHARRFQQMRLWLSLVRLAESQADGPWREELASLERSLPPPDTRAHLFLHVETARLVWRLTGNCSAALARLRGWSAPNPEYHQIAVEAVCLHLRLAALCGDWREHDRLAMDLEAGWMKSTGPQAGWVRVVLAEHAMQRGAYAGALNLLRTIGNGSDDSMRRALLGAQLHALLACGGGLDGSPLKVEVEQAVRLLEPLLVEKPPADDEEQERFWRYSLLVRRAKATGPDRGISSLEDLETALLSREIRRSPETMLTLQFQWVRRQLEQRGAEVAEICEPLLSSVIHESEMQGLPILQMMACDLLADIRAQFLDSFADLDADPAALADAGQAANLGVHFLELNRDSAVERSLRTALLPAFDRALKLLANIAHETEPAMTAERRDAFGRALLDYMEQMAELALSEARNHTRSGGSQALGIPVVLRRVPKASDLQAALRPEEGVLQYFLVARYLIVLAYGCDFLAWSIQEKRDPTAGDPLQIRADLEPLLGTRRVVGMSRRKRTRGSREVRPVGPARAPEISDEEVLRELGQLLLPESIRSILDNHRVQHLAIVPHDILYRAPFGSLPFGTSHVGVRFTLSLHPTGGLAGHRAEARSFGDSRMIVGFFKGPRLKFADAEHEALRQALRSCAEVVFVDTVKKEAGTFSQRAPGCDVLYLACHGQGGAYGGEAWLELGPKPSRVGLSETAALDLRSCRLAVLQSCWTGWMNHRREFPAQGFPQALRDAGVTAVVAPMFKVDDPLCPVFAAVFGRLLRTLPACQALSHALQILRRHGDAVLGADPSTRSYLGTVGVFDSYEYRFTGDPDLRLYGGWMSRVAARIDLAIWIRGRALLSVYWPISRELRRLLAGVSH